MKVLHTADTHLGDLTGPTKDGQNLRRLDTLRCMEAIVASAQAEKPDLAIIAGDLFNRSRVWADTALEDVNDAVTHFIRPLCEASSAVVLLFGTENHDNPRAFELLAELTKDARNLHTVRGIILALRRPRKTQTTRTPPKYGDYTDEKAPQKTSNNPSAKEWE